MCFDPTCVCMVRCQELPWNFGRIRTASRIFVELLRQTQSQLDLFCCWMDVLRRIEKKLTRSEGALSSDPIK